MTEKRPYALHTPLLLATVSVVALALPAGAQNVTGSGTLFAKDKLVAKGCGKVKVSGSQVVAMKPDGTWTAADDGGGALGGTYVPVGTKGRAFDLDFDGPSLLLFQTMLEQDLSELCEASVQVTAIDTKRFRLKLNRKSSKARVKANFRLTGTANGQSGKGSFKVKAKGPWTAMAGSPSGGFLDD
jgi:hypothetical protein